MKSFWQNNTELPKSVFDVIIVGGGIAGLSVAYWANNCGLSCLVLEKGDLAEGASGKNAGFLTGGSINYFVSLLDKYAEQRALELWKFTTDNVALMKEKLELESHADSVGFYQAGTTSLFSESDDLEKIEKAYEILERNKFEVEKVSPILDFERAYKINSDASYDPFKIIQHLSTKLFKTTICTQTTCLKLYQEKGLFQVETNRGVVRSKFVVASTNAHIGKLVPELKNVVRPVRAQIAYIKADNSVLSDANYSIPSERIYFRKFQEGVIMGGLRYLDSKAEDTDEVEINETIQNAIYERCQKYFGKVSLIQKWSGIMGFTQDEQPIYGASKMDEKFLYIGGFSGHGNGYAFKMAKNLVDEYLKGMV